MKKILLPISLLVVIFSIVLFVLIPVKNKPQKEVDTPPATEPETPKSWAEQMQEKYPYFVTDYETRYQSYQQQHPELAEEDVITYVNIGLDQEFYTNTKPTSFLNSNQILVNKYHYVDQNYVPDNLVALPTTYAKSGISLVEEAKTALESLMAAAQAEGYRLHVTSAYRSYDYQQNLYDRYVAQDGKEAADTYSARAGSSEHQTGLAVDLDNTKLDYTLFEQTPEYTWMQDNASKYGFILRFPKGKESITGYQFEAWHYRYVGIDLAQKIKSSGLTFEEYYARYLDPVVLS